MVLGLGSGIFFLPMPFYRLHGMALTAFRYFPGNIFAKGLPGRWGLKCNGINSKILIKQWPSWMKFLHKGSLWV